ncbi:MAG: hypothetical protein LIO91_02320 [Bacteroidales bacterium]|nr:hypothetical protein [Bacteroidales bacterium]
MEATIPSISGIYKVNKPYRAHRHPWLWVALMWALLATGMVAWQGVCVPCLDDRTYCNIPESTDGFWLIQGPKVETLGDALTAIGKHHLYTPARLGNHLQTLSNLLPAWLTRTLLGLCLACLFMMGAWVTAGRQAWQSPGFVAVLWLTLWVTLPLQDGMASSDYAFNYFVPGALALGMALLWRREPLGGHWAWLPWVVAVLTGSGHEAMSLPLAGGLFFTPQFWGKRRWWYRGQWLLMLAVAFAFLFSPGMVRRIGYTQFANSNISQYVVVNIALESYGLYMTIFALLLVAWRWGWRQVWPWARRNAVWILATLLAFGLTIWVGGRGRVLWYCTMFGAMVLFRTLWEDFPWWRTRKLALGAVAMVALLSSIGSAAVVQTRYSAETLELGRLAHAAPTNVVYHDLIPLYEIPWYTLNIPHSSTTSYDLDFLGDEAGTGKVRVLPTCMARGEWQPAPGTAEAMVSNRYLIRRERLPEAHLVATFGPDDGKTNPVYRLINYLSRRNKYYKLDAPMREEAVAVGSDTVWLYWLPGARRLDHNRKIIAVDLP